VRARNLFVRLKRRKINKQARKQATKSEDQFGADSRNARTLALGVS
jgi:hypothetical protein